MNNWIHPLYGKVPVLDGDNSMGLVRYVLAIAVVVAHFNEIFDYNIPFFISSYNAVGGFFALSGFLLYGSYIRNKNAKRYAINRCRRLLPPYILIVSLCAFLLVLVSSLSWKEYFFNTEWAKYLVFNLAFLNFLQPDLPGVFQHGDLTAVNGSLWTMKVEIMLYISVPIVVFLTDLICKKTKYISPLKIFVIIYLISVVYRLLFSIFYQQTEKEVFLILGKQFIGQLMYFYSGVFIFFIYERFKPKIKYLIPICLIIYVVFERWQFSHITILPFIVSCLIISFSSFKGKVSIFNFNNISYDLYLFHFPVIQVFYQYRYVFNNNTPLIFCLSFLSIIALALFSWHFIEKRFLARKFI